MTAENRERLRKHFEGLGQKMEEETNIEEPVAEETEEETTEEEE